MSLQQTIPHVYQPTALPENAKDVSTMCILCAHTCGIKVDIENNRLTNIRGDESNPGSKGYVCNKAFALDMYTHNANRIEQPLKRQTDGTFAPITWDQAIQEIAEKLNHIRHTYSPHAIGMAGLGGQGQHLSGFGAIPLLYGIGTKMIFTALAQEKTQHALVDRHLVKATHDLWMLPDICHSDYAVIMGSNPLITNVSDKDAISAFAKDSERTLVVIDPRASETARRADKHLRIKPSTDIYLLMAIAGVIVQEGLTDQLFIKEKIYEYELVKNVLLKVDINAMAVHCGLDVDNIRTLAKEFATAKRASIEIGLGLEQSPHSTLISYMARVVLLITGNYGRKGGNVLIPLYGPKMPFFKRAPKATSTGVQSIHFFLPLPQLSPAIIPEEIESDHPERLRALILDNSNPIASYPDTQNFECAFKKLDLLVVVDPMMSESARMADYILPAPVSYEKWDWSNFPKEVVAPQVRHAIINSSHNVLPEPEIYFRLAHAMGMVGKAPRILHRLAKNATHTNGLNAAAYLTMLNTLAALQGGGSGAIIARSSYWLYETLGSKLANPMLAYMWILTVGYAATRRSDILAALPELKSIKNPLKLANLLFDKLIKNPQGVLIGKYEKEHNFEFFCRYKDGRARIYQADYMRDIEALSLTAPKPQDFEYPFTLDAGVHTGFTANTIMQNPAWRKGKGPHVALSISPEDAQSLQLTANDRVKVSTRRGSVEVPVKIDPNTLQGHVHLPNMHNQRYPDPITGELRQTGIRLNDLVDAKDRDIYTGCPQNRHLRCKIEKTM